MYFLYILIDKVVVEKVDIKIIGIGIFKLI